MTAHTGARKLGAAAESAFPTAEARDTAEAGAQAASAEPVSSSNAEAVTKAARHSKLSIHPLGMTCTRREVALHVRESPQRGAKMGWHIRSKLQSRDLAYQFSVEDKMALLQRADEDANATLRLGRAASHEVRHQGTEHRWER